MRREKTIKLIHDWANRLCIHKHTEEEFYPGKPSGDMVCTICRKALGKKSTQNMKNILKKNFKKNSKCDSSGLKM